MGFELPDLHELVGHDVTWAFVIEPVADDLYAWSQGGDASLVNLRELQDLMQKMQGGRDGLGGAALE